MDDAGLNHGIGEHGSNGIRKALEAVDNRQHDIIDTPVLELVHDAKPELGPFILLDPQPKHLLAAIRTNAEGNVDRFAADHAFVADFNPDRVEEHQRIGRIERALLPSDNFLQNGIGDGRYQIGRYVYGI